MARINDNAESIFLPQASFISGGMYLGIPESLKEDLCFYLMVFISIICSFNL